MAQINQINGVATSGTTGVNNVFGSGGGGSGTLTTTPTFTHDAASRFSNTVTITNHASFTQGVQYKVVTTLGGSMFDSQLVTGTDTIVIADTQATAGTRTITVTAQQFGDFYESAEVTGTYTKQTTNYRYFRLQAMNDDGTETHDNVGWDEFRLYSGTGQTGTQYPPNLTSNTSGEAAGYYIDSEFTFSTTSYPFYKAYDSNVNSWTWTLTLSAANKSQNHTSFHFDATIFPTPPDIGSWRTKLYNPSCDLMILYGSNTGAFSGEETELDRLDCDSQGFRTMFNRG